MGYLALAFLIGVIIWTFWRLFNHKRIPLNYFSTLDEDKSKNEMKNDEEDTKGK